MDTRGIVQIFDLRATGDTPEANQRFPRLSVLAPTGNILIS